MALRAYRGYGRYLVELMRLPSRAGRRGRRARAGHGRRRGRRLWREAPGGGLIFAVGHVGNNEAVAAAIARHGMPISVVADDSSFPELFEILRQQREAWGVTIIAWRNLREIFGVLHRREMLALLVDWGYRSDGIPVRLFGAWTALPAGRPRWRRRPARGSCPIAIRRQPGRHVPRLLGRGRSTSPRRIPAELQRATQAMADALARHDRGGARAVVQLQADLAGDAPRRRPTSSVAPRLMQAGVAGPGPRRAGRSHEPTAGLGRLACATSATRA